MDRIEDIEIDVDEDGMRLVLQGDFVAAFSEYLDKGPLERTHVNLLLPRDTAEALRSELNDRLDLDFQ